MEKKLCLWYYPQAGLMTGKIFVFSAKLMGGLHNPAFFAGLSRKIKKKWYQWSDETLGREKIPYAIQKWKTENSPFFPSGVTKFFKTSKKSCFQSNLNYLW